MSDPRARKARLEKHEQQDGVKLLRSLGAAVYVLGTKRRKGDYQGTNQTPGIADVEAWMPTKRSDQCTPWMLSRQLLKWEVKRSRGAKTSVEQESYAALCTDAGVSYVCGDLSALMRWLVDAGYLRADQVPAERFR